MGPKVSVSVRVAVIEGVPGSACRRCRGSSPPGALTATGAATGVARPLRGRYTRAVTLGAEAMLVATTNDMPGYRVTAVIGMVRGITVRSRSVVGNLGGAIQSIFGGNLSIYTEL